jgi:hypothetical protein
LEPIPIPEWKWDVTNMDFIIGFLKSKKQNDSIMVVVEKLTKDGHFVRVKPIHKVINIHEIIF